ncbi:MAG: glycogen debranching protein GlgX [Alphaproteobacteria bacterium]|nr:glycogen debranching protein GlgX [Alphaproteobacteria bacterium]
MAEVISVKAGKPHPLGATFDGSGVNFAIFSAHATKVELCLFNDSGAIEVEKFELKNRTGNIWHLYLSGAKSGQVYGYRVHGPYEPNNGHRFNPHKLLIDPYGKKLVGKLIWHKAIFGYDLDSPEKDLSFSQLDSAPYVPKSVVVDNAFDWGSDKHPDIPFENSVIYETHTRGYTKLHPKVPDAARGKFLGLTAPAVIKYIKWLGVTAVELLPIHAFFGNRHKKGFLTDNYWGYESFSFFAPEQNYLVHGEIDEFKAMVKSLHKNGLEVILDVVYNHTGEGNQLGPTISFRGIDNASYYTLHPKDKRYYFDSTGCGASFNVQNPDVLRLVMDSLRYWVEEMHVDGFRFDLATSLSRMNMTFSQDSGFMMAVKQDPVLSQVKLIAEPWDVDMGGYQVGAFMTPWAEWNDKYRDVLRSFWKGDASQISNVGSRVAGSSDVFNHYNRNIWSSVNFITAHDGFCLRDLVSYNAKHNVSNGEENRDGSNNNISWNSGFEGETENKTVHNNRQARARAMLSTLLFSFGTPMLVAGDELFRTQFGNNNPYCQDNIITWIAWDAIDEKDIEFVRFIKRAVALRRKLRVFNRKTFFMGRVVKKDVKDITWYDDQGIEFTSEDWNNANLKSISYLIYDGTKSVYVVLNANFMDTSWKLPNLGENVQWSLLLDSSQKLKEEMSFVGGKSLKVPAWSVLLFEVKL